VRPFLTANFWPYSLTPAAERALKPTQSFKECTPGQGKDYCPEMVVIPAGSFIMGSPASEQSRTSDEGPQHKVEIAKSFAVSKYELTFDEWDTCAYYGDCPRDISDSDWHRGRQPAINVSWNDAQRYVTWLSKVIGHPYRLLTEAEYEYATRAGTQTIFPWGNEIGTNNANCNQCGSQWGGYQTAPVGSFRPNRFGLYDMVGNVWEWVEDCLHYTYDGAPTDGSAWIEGGVCNEGRVLRGGSWNLPPRDVRSAQRFASGTGIRIANTGFRVARTLLSP
jgi:formylglycine-generating enzyme required for sulfatase activity